MKSPALCLFTLIIFSASPALTKDEPLPSGKAVSPLEYRDEPLPFGTSFWYFGQEQDYAVTGLRASAFGFPIPGFDDTAISRIENRVDQFNFKADYWVLPWLNIHGIIGTASGEATATLSPAIQRGFGLTDFKVDYDALVYGGGITLATGYKCFFATLTADYTRGDVDMEDGAGLTLNDPNGIETLIVTPKIGVRGEKGAIWVGAYYQFTEHTQTGTFILPGPLPVAFSADVEDKTPWNPVIGGEYYFSEQWSLTLEYGFGDDRHQSLIGLTHRF